jgi:methyl-accepting chemotaxis protein
MASSALSTAFNRLVSDIESEARVLKCLANLRGLAGEDTGSSQETTRQLEEIAAAVNRLEHSFQDIESFIDSELAALDAFGELCDRSAEQGEALRSMVAPSS